MLGHALGALLQELVRLTSCSSVDLRLYALNLTYVPSSISLYRGLYNTLAWTPTFYAEQYGIGVRDSAWLSVLPSVAGAAGGILAGNLADAFLRRHQESNNGVIDERVLTNIRKTFQGIALYGPAVALGALWWHLPEDPVVAQTFLMAAVGLQAFTSAGFDAGNQEKAGPKWAGLLYSVTSLPAVIFGTTGGKFASHKWAVEV